MSANSPAMTANFSVKRGYVVIEPMLGVALSTGPEIPGNPNTTFTIKVFHLDASASGAYSVALADSYNGLIFFFVHILLI